MNDPNNLPLSAWLPTTMKEARKRGQEEFDVVLVTGDAYVDHPAFGAAVIGRICESYGLSVAIISQPNWQDDLRDFKKFGTPKLFFGVTAGNMDSMVNKYTAGKRMRSKDAYTPGGDTNFRPDYAASEYTKILKELYPDTPVLLGGIEASLRRVTHYDYWQDKLMPNILSSSGADMLIYGMGEQPLREIVQLLKRGVPFSSLKTIPQTAMETGKFKTLLAAAEAAGLVQALSADGPITVFAPTDEAFAKLPEGTVETLLKPENKAMLAEVLTYHVVPGRIYSDAALKAGTAKTLNGATASINARKDGVFVNNSQVIAADLDTSNGVIHVIDSVMLPPQKTAEVGTN